MYVYVLYNISLMFASLAYSLWAFGPLGLTVFVDIIRFGVPLVLGVQVRFMIPKVRKVRSSVCQNSGCSGFVPTLIRIGVSKVRRPN